MLNFLSNIMFNLKYGNIVKRVIAKTGLPEDKAIAYVKFFYVDNNRDIVELRNVLREYCRQWIPYDGEDDDDANCVYVFDFPKGAKRFYCKNHRLLTSFIL